MEIMTEYLVLFYLFDCFYLSAMTVVNIAVVNMTVEKFKDYNLMTWHDTSSLWRLRVMQCGIF